MDKILGSLTNTIIAGVVLTVIVVFVVNYFAAA